MTTSLSKEEIISIALDCDGLLTDTDEIIADCMDVERFAYLVAAAEREECAKICDSVNNYDNPMTANDCADAIRARGQS